jgi:hypothetical protein
MVANTEGQENGGEYGAPTKVEADPGKLKEEGADLKAWGTATLRNYRGLVGMVFPIGDFPAASRLRAKLDECIKQLATNAWNIGNELEKVIPDNLTYSADQYIQDDDDNAHDAERAAKFSTETNAYGPGAEKTFTAPAGMPPPTEPKQVPVPEEIKNPGGTNS